MSPTSISRLIPEVLNSLVDERVWESETPDDIPRDAQGLPKPFIVWDLVGGQDAEYIEQTPFSTHSNARVQIEVMCPSVLEAESLIKQARDALLASGYTVSVLGSPIGTLDGSRKLRGRRQQFSIWFQQL